MAKAFILKPRGLTMGAGQPSHGGLTKERRMSLANGRPYLAIPGPSVIPDRVLRAMHRGSPNIYEGPLIEMVASLFPDLRMVAGTTGQVAIYMAMAMRAGRRRTRICSRRARKLWCWRWVSSG
jgi:hypothetical protein